MSHDYTTEAICELTQPYHWREHDAVGVAVQMWSP